MLVDSHTHLYLDDFDADGGGEAAVVRAVEAGIDRFMFPNVDLTTIEPMKRLAARFPDRIDMAMGLHPTEVKADWHRAMEVVESELSTGRYKAVGEVGIDLYWDKTYRREQTEAFEHQCRLAVEKGLPVIIHCREGLDEVLAVFDSMEKIPRALFHSFGGSADDVSRIRERGDFYFGINGIVTFKNSSLRQVLPEIGVNRILLETDSPYLAPVPKRGRRNESAYIVHTAAYVAQALDMKLSELADVTTANYLDFIGGCPNKF